MLNGRIKKHSFPLLKKIGSAAGNQFIYPDYPATDSPSGKNESRLQKYPP